MSDELLEQVKVVLGNAARAAALHDLLHHAVADLVIVINGDDFPVAADLSNEELARRTDTFEALAPPVIRATAWGSYYGDASTRLLWPSIVGRAANTVIRTGGNHDVWHSLNRYSATLILYAAGLAAVGSERADLLAPLLVQRAVQKTDDCGRCASPSCDVSLHQRCG